MFENLDIRVKRYEQLNEELQDPAISSDIKKYTAIMKEHKSLEKIVVKYQEFLKLEQEIKDLKELCKDPEMRELAELDLEEANAKYDQVIEDIKVLLIPRDENDDKNVIMEIRGAAGGDEANIFAADLFRMYSKYAESKGYKIEITNSQPTGLGGFSTIEFMVSGEGAYSFLKYESGAHRVQRIPVTEANGRIQTSTATVLVMPEADELDAHLDPADVRVDIFCASGPGGQCVNTTKSAIRLTHIPTGIVVSCQDGKNQHENKANAFKVLQARLYDKMLQDKLEAEGKERLSKIGHGDRSEKIRTYNYPQNRVTDHRIGLTIQQLDRIMEGRLDAVIDALIQEDQRQKMENGESTL